MTLDTWPSGPVNSPAPLAAVADPVDNEPVTWFDRAADVSNERGSYLLLIRLPTALFVDRPAPLRLDAGWYIYAGSARGPGGVRARVKRHFDTNKSVRWHVDQLTNAADRVFAAAFFDLGECDLVRGLTAQEGLSFPHPGFGSSDCKSCEAHLLRYDMAPF